MHKPIRPLLTCEHGGNRVPRRYSCLFRGFDELRAGHRGFDPGALAVARRLANELQCRLFASTTTRLLVDLNRSIGNRSLFSEVTRDLSADEKPTLLARHYHPYRNEITAGVGEWVAGGDCVLHVAVHSFTPCLRGVVRNADIGLLYDPARPGERAFCAFWRRRLGEIGPELRVRRNYPYLGVADGLPTWLRRTHPDHAYVGVELEINQRLFESRTAAGGITRMICASLPAAITDFAASRGGGAADAASPGGD